MFKNEVMKRSLITASFLLFIFVLATKVTAQNSAKELLQQKTEKQLQKIISRSSGITGLATVDLTSGETIFSFNSDLSFPQGSAIKIPILMEVFKQVHEGAFKLSEKISIKSGNVVGGSGIIKDLKTPVSLSIRNISTLMIALSDNTATNVLIDRVGMSNVNSTLESLGLQQTVLQRKMMDIKASAEGQENLSTPAEAAKILKMLYNGAFINKQISSDIIAILKKPGRKHSRLASGIPAEVPVAFKYGMLKGVSTEWAVILLPERPYAVAVMEYYKVGGEDLKVVENLSQVLYDYFWRMGNSTEYGVYRPPSLIK